MQMYYIILSVWKASKACFVQNFIFKKHNIHIHNRVTINMFFFFFLLAVCSLPHLKDIKQCKGMNSKIVLQWLFAVPNICLKHPNSVCANFTSYSMFGWLFLGPRISIKRLEGVVKILVANEDKGSSEPPSLCMKRGREGRCWVSKPSHYFCANTTLPEDSLRLLCKPVCSFHQLPCFGYLSYLFFSQPLANNSIPLESITDCMCFQVLFKHVHTQNNTY